MRPTTGTQLPYSSTNGGKVLLCALCINYIYVSGGVSRGPLPVLQPVGFGRTDISFSCSTALNCVQSWKK